VDYVGDTQGVGAGGITYTAGIRKNGTPVTSQSHTFGGGLGALPFAWSLTNVSIAVVPGDLIEGYFQIAVNTPNICVIPGGTGRCDHMLWCRGTLT
jgi:hypothetical protein